mmetsp:Transcript_33540/g.94170  ORF Transcript_33540/g.94170 Transcript_33540/m.94170 type:complete len:246 (+) Transcript_33540:750-1487(+)
MSTSLERLCWPPPQEALQSPQDPQSPSTHSSGDSSRRHPKVESTGLHGPVSCRLPSQCAPRPLAWPPMPRDRFLVPSQSLLQRPQASQAENLQSMLSSHATPILQLANSFDGPVAGVPHWLASDKSFRERQVRPPSQGLEHGSQSSQSSQRPSTQRSSEHFCILHGWVSSLLTASQGLPPFTGDTAMWRSRDLWPPSHSELQLLQSDQSLHLQSIVGQGSIPTHSRVSFNARLQPSPPSLDFCAT